MQKMKRITWGLGAGILLLGLLVWFGPKLWRGLTSLELLLMDVRHQLSPATQTEQDVIIVEIDTASLSRLDSWPWPRSYYADVIKTLDQYGASVIGFDVIFDSVSGHAPDEDVQLSAAIRESGNVVLASKWYQQSRGGYEVTGWSKPIAMFRQYAKSGVVNKPLDPDNKVRRAWISPQRGEPTWIGQVYEAYVGKPVPKQRLRMLHYHGSERSFLTIPFFILKENLYPNPSAFKGKIVLIGASDPILHDFFYTPFGIMPGVEIHANAIQGLLDQDELFETSLPINLAITLIMMALSGLIGLRLSALKSVFLMIALQTVYAAVAIGIFLKTQWFIAWAMPMAGSVLVYAGVFIRQYMSSEHEKRYIRSLFQQYVAPSVVAELLRDPKKINLGGESREVTIFFSDIRSFTTYCESHEPSYVIAVLNEYLEAMTKCIFKWQGTIDKFVGDEIMAIWGAPLDQPDHAKLALRCCWDQLHELRLLQKKWLSEGKDPMDIGMGLNTGVVAVGNIGSSIRKDYTVMGDAVNLGARLEAETRHHGTPEEPCYLIISEFTYERVKDICEVKPLGPVKVKGKNKSVEIYEVIDVRF